MGLAAALASLATLVGWEQPLMPWREALDATRAGGWLDVYASPGPFSVCFANSSQVGVFPSLPNYTLPPFSALISFPCAEPLAEGAAVTGAVLAAAGMPAAGWNTLSFSIGYQGWPGRYTQTFAHLSSHGFIIIAPRTIDLNPLPLSIWKHQQLLLLSIGWLAQELPGCVDLERSGAFGHSMGGGDAAIAAALSSNNTFGRALGSPPRWNLVAHWIIAPPFPLPKLRAFAALGLAPEDAPLAALSSIGASANGLYVGGTHDTFAPALWQRLAFAFETGPRMLVIIRGGTHCYLDLHQKTFYPLSQCGAAALFGESLMDQSDQLWLSRALLVAHFTAALSRDGAAASAAAARLNPLALALRAPAIAAILTGV